MSQLIKNTTSEGVYLLIEENGRIAAGAPGDIDLDNLVLGTGYIYFDDFIQLEEAGTAQRTDKFFGWNISPDLTTKLKVKAQTGANMFLVLNLRVHLTNTQRNNFVKFFQVHQSPTQEQLFLVVQWESEAFEQYSYNTTLQDHLEVIPAGYRIITTLKEGKYVRTLDLQLINAFKVITS